MPPPPPTGAAAARKQSQTSRPGVFATWLRTAGPQTLLAMGGVLLLVTAAIVFTAVAWRDLPTAVRGGVLVVAALGSAGLTRLLTSRGLERTAEATAVLSVALLGVLLDALWRAGAFGGSDGLTVTTASFASLAAYSHLLASVTRARAPRVLAGWQMAAAVGSGGLRLADVIDARFNGLDVAIVAGGLLAGATVAAVYARYRLGDLPRWRAITYAGAVGWWSLASLLAVAVLWLLDPGAADDTAGLAVGTVVVVLAVWTALAARSLGHAPSLWEPVGAGGAWLLATTAGAAVLDPRLSDWQMARFLLPAMLGCVAVWALPSGRARRGAAAGMIPVVVVAAVPWMAITAWHIDVATARLEAPWTAVLLVGAAPAAAHLVMAAGAVGVTSGLAVALGRRGLAALGGVLGGASVLLGAAAVVWPAGGGVVATIGVAGVAAAWMYRAAAPHQASDTLDASDVQTIARHLGPTVALAGATLLGVAMALVGALATIVALTMLGVAAAAALVAALRVPPLRVATVRTNGGRPQRPPALRADVAPVLAAMLIADLIGLVAAVVAASTDRWGPAGVGVTLASAVAWLVVTEAPHRARVAVPVDATAGVGFAVGIAAAAIDVVAVWQAVAFAVLAIAATGMAAVRDDRAWMRWVAAAAASATSWTLLREADVDTVEAYTMPPAVLLLAMGAATLWRRRAGSSWRALGPGLGLLLTPTVVLVLDDPGDLRRLLTVVVMGCMLAVVGRAWRLQAPLVAGVVASAMVALPQIEVVTDVVPRWMLLATGGSLLLWLSISYERQLQRLSAVRSNLAQMR